MVTDRRCVSVCLCVQTSEELESLAQTGVCVSVCVQASEELEDRESLAQIAGSGTEAADPDGETYIGE